MGDGEIHQSVIDALRLVVPQLGPDTDSATLRRQLNKRLKGSSAAIVDDIDHVARAIDNGAAGALLNPALRPSERSHRAFNALLLDSEVPDGRAGAVVRAWARALTPTAGQKPSSPPTPPPTQPAEPARPRTLAVAAAVAVVGLIVGLLFFRGEGLEPASAPEVSAARGPSPGPTEPPPATTTAPATTIAPVSSLGGDYMAIKPARAIDSRSGVGLPAGKVSTGSIDLGTVVPAERTKAVALNVTIIDPTVDSYVTITASGQSRDVSQLAFNAGSVSSSLVVTPTSGANVDVRLAQGQAHLVIDVVGYFSAGTSGAGLRLAAESRPRPLIDTRTLRAAVAPQGYLDVLLPNDNQRGAMLALTVADATEDGYVTAFAPTAGDRPEISTINFRRNTDVTGTAIVVTPDRAVRVFNGSGGTIHLAVSQLASLVDTTTGTGLTFDVAGDALPARLADSRTVGRACGSTEARISTAAYPSAKAILASITVTGSARAGYLQAYGDRVAPAVPTLTFAAGEQRSNLALIPVIDGSVRIRCGFGEPAYAIDVLATFS